MMISLNGKMMLKSLHVSYVIDLIIFSLIEDIIVGNVAKLFVVIVHQFISYFPNTPIVTEPHVVFPNILNLILNIEHVINVWKRF